MKETWYRFWLNRSNEEHGIIMTDKISSKREKNRKWATAPEVYNMGHILYMAQLSDTIQKKILIDSVPKHERERYKLAFENLVTDRILIKPKKGEKRGNYSINPKRTEKANELIHFFVKGTKEGRGGRQIQRNPFFHRGPIKDIEHFIGRRDVISHIFDRLRHTEDCSIIGPRAIGKTSLLHYISHEEVIKKYHLDPKKYIFVYYDLERFGKNAEVKDFYYEMFSRTLSQINLSELITGEGIKKINEESGNVIKKINKSLFELEDLEALVAALSERDFCVIYMIDEFEYVANNPTFDFSFYGQLRALSGNPVLKVAFITASKKSIYDLTFMEEIKTSPFFRYFEDFRLGLISKTELSGFFDLAVENGVVFQDQIKTIIEEWSGGHPFLVQLACDYFFDLDMRGDEFKNGEEEKHLEVFIRKHKKHFAYFWKQVEGKEQKCLYQLATGKTLSPECKDVLDSLEESFLVFRKNGGYQIFSKAFEKYVGDIPFKESN